MRSFVRTLFFLGASITLTTSTGKGQIKAPVQEVDLAVTYTAQQSNITPGQSFWFQGGTFELSAEAYHGFGIITSISGQRASNLLNTGIDLNTVTSNFGPRYTWWTSGSFRSQFDRRISCLGWTLLCLERSGHRVQQLCSPGWRRSGPALGSSLRHSIQADWARTKFPNATTTVQNKLRVGAGVVIRTK